MTNWRIPKWLWDDYETITELEARIKELEALVELQESLLDSHAVAGDMLEVENAIGQEDQPEINITP